MSGTSAEDLPRYLVARLQNIISPQSRLSVALSGGRDSVVLLHALQLCRTELAVALSAIHVNHQISPHADSWAEFCGKLCESLRVPLHVERVTVARASGKGLEAAARRARYDAFAALDVDAILLAHHRDDQAETVLLQALRGAGLKGITGMPVVKTNERKSIIRPFLNIDSRTLAAYAAHYKLEWIEDESNDDIRYFRNYLRHEVLPGIAVHAPQYRESLTRLARHAAEAQQLLDELAELDSSAVIDQGQLKIELLLRLSDARAKNLLRYFFSRNGIATPSSIQMSEIMHQLRLRRPDDRTEIQWADRVLRCHAGNIHIEVVDVHNLDPWSIPWCGETVLPLPQGCGVLHLVTGIGTGISTAMLQQGLVTIRCRVGGEQLRTDAARPRRTLKNLLQEAGVPPWQRARMPLLFCGEMLIWAPGIGIATGYAASENEDSISIAWQHYTS